jgi:hypothetical protein
MLTFPTGRALSPTWRPFLLLELLALAFILFTGLFGETVSALDGRWTVENPLGFIPEIWDDGPVGPMFQASLLVLLGAGLVSMLLRFDMPQPSSGSNSRVSSSRWRSSPSSSQPWLRFPVARTLNS